jgi:hypothetical protein
MASDESTQEGQTQGDPSESLDMVTVFTSAGTAAEMEALEVQALLESNGIQTVLIGDSRWPNLPEEVRVSQADADRARALIDEAVALGPEAAEEAEAAQEAEAAGENS